MDLDLTFLPTSSVHCSMLTVEGMVCQLVNMTRCSGACDIVWVMLQCVIRHGIDILKINHVWSAPRGGSDTEKYVQRQEIP